ncbi:ferritin-like domain-containing protein [Flavobacterium sp. DGU38]|uniref:Ferritin-like domain-containing protein n=1 Tax=Flavobacterium calami TaxID=3139144 RepID=A0ABU9ILS9_9FLAO
MKNSVKSTQNKTAVSRDSKNIVSPSTDAASELRTFFIDSLKDIYWAENALIGALPKMASNATSPALTVAILEHLAVTENQVIRLNKVFELLGEKAEGKKCEAMAGLLKEGDSILQETLPGAVRDAGIIAASQKIEHYEIASYGTLCAFAKALGENDTVKLLTKTLAEEKEADCLLNDIALNAVNLVAAE